MGRNLVRKKKMIFSAFFSLHSFIPSSFSTLLSFFLSSSFPIFCYSFNPYIFLPFLHFFLYCFFLLYSSHEKFPFHLLLSVIQQDFFWGRLGSRPSGLWTCNPSVWAVQDRTATLLIISEPIQSYPSQPKMHHVSNWCFIYFVAQIVFSMTPAVFAVPAPTELWLRISPDPLSPRNSHHCAGLCASFLSFNMRRVIAEITNLWGTHKIVQNVVFILSGIWC